MDTAINYQRFQAHRVLAREAGDLLKEFEVTTKIGFFAGPGGPRHSLEPGRLRNALWTSVEDLGIPPRTVLLHNPESSLSDLRPSHAYELLATACAVLAEASAVGLCGAWGISTWDPATLLRTLPHGTGCPTPEVLMVRAGLSLDGAQLQAADRLELAFGVDADRVWGMSPFAGSTSDPVWRTVNLSAFLEPGQEFSPVQAAFRLAFELPAVQRVAVGTSSSSHLSELVEAVNLRVADGTIERYRKLVTSSELADTNRQ